MVVQANYVAGHRRLCLITVACEKGYRVGNLHILAESRVAHLHIARILTRAEAHEGDSISVFGIHIRLDLKDEASKPRLCCGDVARLGRTRLRRWCIFHEVVEHFFHAEIAERRAEIDRRHLTAQISVEVEIVTRAAHQFYFVAEVVPVTA